MYVYGTQYYTRPLILSVMYVPYHMVLSEKVKLRRKRCKSLDRISRKAVQTLGSNKQRIRFVYKNSSNFFGTTGKKVKVIEK